MNTDRIKPAEFHRPMRLQLDNFTDNLWGGDWIPRLKGLPAPVGPVGESWEFSGHARRPSFLPEAHLSVRDALAQAAPDILGERIVRRFGSEAPFLLKLIDSRDDLSVQVHPDDVYARAHAGDAGKAESWIILGTEGAQGGSIYIGFDPRRAESFGDEEAFSEAFLAALNQANAQGPSEDPSVRARAERLVLPFLNRVPVKAGDVFDLRPGTVHAIGRGVRLFEIQQTSDVTYRVWDWNRPDPKKLKEGKKEFRAMHLAQAKDVLDFRPRPVESYRCVGTERPWDGAGTRSRALLVKDAQGRYAAEKLSLGAGGRGELPVGFCVLTVVSGAMDLQVGSAVWGRVSAGASVLIPAAAKDVRCASVGESVEVIRSFVPE